ITFRKALKTLPFDGAMMNKDIFSALDRNKSVTLLIVEPLYCTLRHNSSNPFILLVCTLLNARNINVKSPWRQEIKQERLVSVVLLFLLNMAFPKSQCDFRTVGIVGRQGEQCSNEFVFFIPELIQPIL